MRENYLKQLIYSTLKNGRILKFGLVGGSAAVLNLVLMVLLVGVLGFNSYILKNLANLLAIIISTLYAFYVHRSVTWGDVREGMVFNTEKQLTFFITTAFFSIILRVLLFYLFDLIGLYYIINVILGIGLAACVNFVINDKVVFKTVKR